MFLGPKTVFSRHHAPKFDCIPILKTYIISLPKSEERRNFQREQLTRLGLEHVIFDAVSTQQLEGIDPGIRLDQWERLLMPTEVACFFSHFRLWQLIAASSQPALVLEDDALLSSRTPVFLQSVKVLSGVDHITLETRLRKKLLGPVKTLDANLGISRLYQDRTGAAAYILWPSGAKLLIKQAQESGAALADAFISNFYRINSWQAVPALAVQSDVASQYGVESKLQTHSYIQANDRRENHQLTGLGALRFKARRLGVQLKLAKRFVQCVGAAKRVLVNVVPEDFNSPSH